MAKESIRRIREAEAAAAEIIAEAERAAADMLAIAESRGKDHLDRVMADCEAENRRKLAEVSTLADQMVESGRAEATRAAKQLRLISGIHSRDAVKMIVQGILEQCQ